VSSLLPTFEYAFQFVCTQPGTFSMQDPMAI